MDDLCLVTTELRIHAISLPYEYSTSDFVGFSSEICLNFFTTNLRLSCGASCTTDGNQDVNDTSVEISFGFDGICRFSHVCLISLGTSALDRALDRPCEPLRGLWGYCL
jgi:hypothetical protein